MEPGLAELVVNLHITERCNYSCSYCFGKWGIQGSDEVFQDRGSAVALISDVFDVCTTLGRDRADPPAIRFNFAGGEPALVPDLPAMIEFCRGLGARTSIVTNGLAVRRFDAQWLKHNVDIIGISIDSAADRTNVRIGRATRSGRPFDLAEIARAVADLRRAGHRAIKMNTVVSRENLAEDFSDVLRALRPDRWKVMQMLPVYGSATAVSSAEFDAFLRRHSASEAIISSENNEEMTSSYLMIDPMGRFFWTSEGSDGSDGSDGSHGSEGSAGNGYAHSRPIMESGAAAALAECPISWDKYRARYRTEPL